MIVVIGLQRSREDRKIADRIPGERKTLVASLSSGPELRLLSLLQARMHLEVTSDRRTKVAMLYCADANGYVLLGLLLGFCCQLPSFQEVFFMILICRNTFSSHLTVMMVGTESSIRLLGISFLMFKAGQELCFVDDILPALCTPV